MHTIPEITAFEADMRAWRHHIHAHPETAFEETATSAFVADKLRSFGLEVHAGLAGTGVVGVLKSGHGNGAIGLRADLDALHIHEKSGVAHASKVEGKMHACGHDGHTAMLLGQQHGEDAARGVARNAGAVDAAADDEEIVEGSSHRWGVALRAPAFALGRPGSLMNNTEFYRMR